MTSPLIVSIALGSYIRLYWVPGPQPPLPRHIIPGPRCAYDEIEASKMAPNAIAITKLNFFIYSHLLSSLDF
jgi:hypothetical protein